MVQHPPAAGKKRGIIGARWGWASTHQILDSPPRPDEPPVVSWNYTSSRAGIALSCPIADLATANTWLVCPLPTQDSVLDEADAARHPMSCLQIGLVIITGYKTGLDGLASILRSAWLGVDPGPSRWCLSGSVWLAGWSKQRSIRLCLKVCIVLLPQPFRVGERLTWSFLVVICGTPCLWNWKQLLLWSLFSGASGLLLFRKAFNCWVRVAGRAGAFTEMFVKLGKMWLLQPNIKICLF